MAKTNVPVPHVGPLDSTTGAQRDGIIFPSAVYDQATGTFNSPEYVNLGWRGVRLFVDITAIGLAGTVDMKVQVKDPASLNWVDFPGAAIAQQNSNTTVFLTIYPGQNETATVDISDPLGIRWRVVLTIGTNDVTCSVGGEYLF